MSEPISEIRGGHAISNPPVVSRNTVLTLLGLSLLCSITGASSSSGSGSSGTGGSGRSLVQKLSAPVYTRGDYYLAPNGDDANPCTLNQPCKTINGIQTGHSLGPGKVVLLRGGFYYLTDPILPTVSGTSGSPIVYAAYPYETPIITGAKPIAGWTLTTAGQCAGISNCYSTVLANGLNNFEYLIYVPSGWPASYVVASMTRRTQSVNTPSGYNLNAGAVKEIDDPTCTSDGTHCLDRVNIKDGDVISLAYNLADDRFYNFANWNVDSLRLLSYSTTKLVFTGPALPPPQSGFFNTGPRYLIVNSVEYFKLNHAPGTFYIDCGNGTPCAQSGSSTLPSNSIAYYIAQAGENPATDTILAPQLTSLITDGPASPANYLTFQGITFVGDNFVTPFPGYQSDTGQPGATAALSFVDTTGITIDSSVIAHTSGWGLEFTNDKTGTVQGPSISNQLLSSALYDIGASGIRLGRMPPNNSDSGNSNDAWATNNSTVTNNLFMGIGRMFPGGEAGCVWIGSSHDNKIEHNDCVDSYGGGVAVGPRVTVTAGHTHDNSVQFNNFHELGEGVIDDFGCVHFANYGATGNKFQNNICHDITHAVADNLQGGTGIYVDNNSQNVTIENNLVYRTSGALFFNNGSGSNCPPSGCNNMVSSNILAYSYQGAVKRGSGSTGSDSLQDFVFKHNVVYFDVGKGPQWLNSDGTGFWDCGPGNINTPAPCTSYFGFYSNDYWSPKLASPTFTTTAPTTSWLFGTSHGQWQSSPGGGFPNDPGEDQSADSAPISIYSNPGFVGPNYAANDFHFTGAAPNIGFDSTGFGYTYTAGRNSPSLYPPPPLPGFPLQLLSPLQF